MLKDILGLIHDPNVAAAIDVAHRKRVRNPQPVVVPQPRRKRKRKLEPETTRTTTPPSSSSSNRGEEEEEEFDAETLIKVTQRFKELIEGKD